MIAGVLDNVCETRQEAMPETPAHRQLIPGAAFLYDMWYYALPGCELKRGQTVGKIMLNEPVLIGRDAQGKVFALRDICPHQAVPFSAGSFDGKNIVCSFHGWKFDTEGVCTEIPSLVEEQCLNLCAIKAYSYLCREVQGNIWVYFGHNVENLPAVPLAPGLGNAAFDQTTVRLLLPNHIDYNAVALVDTAHVPYVHKSWWWRSSRNMKEKTKLYVPSGTGWTMVKHRPSKHSLAFNLIGDYIETEIGFRLPACRLEHIQVNGKTILSGLTTLTPIDETHTELHHTTYWLRLPGLKPFLTPVIRYFVTEFLSQDRSMAELQQEALKYKPNLIMTIKDAGTPGKWYFQLKKEWAASLSEKREFCSPVKESILRWRT